MGRGRHRLLVGDALAYGFGAVGSAFVCLLGVVVFVVGDTLARFLVALLLVGFGVLVRHVIKGLIKERRIRAETVPDTPWGADYEPSEEPFLALRNAAKNNDAAYLASALASPNRHVVRSAVRRLGKIGDPRAVEPLLALLDGGDRGDQILVIGALSRIGDSRAVPAVYAIATNGRANWSVRGPAARALGELGDRRGIPLLAEVLARADGVPAEQEFLFDQRKLFHYTLSKRWAARALVEQGGVEALPILESAPRDSLGWRDRLALSKTIRRLRTFKRKADRQLGT